MPRKKQSQRRKAVTMRDVARYANVSQSTVSRILSGAKSSEAISADTHDRVRNAVRLLGYRPNLHAGSLRGYKTRMVAVMVADIANPFFHPLVRAIQDEANQHEYDVIVSNTDYTVTGERSFLQSVMRRSVDGVVLVPSHMSASDIQMLIERTGAVVGIVGQQVDHALIDVALNDDAYAMQHTASWLISQKGHRRVGFIGVEGDFPAALRRDRGYRAALTQHDITFRPDYAPLGDWTEPSGFKAMNRLLDLPDPPTAVIACNDLMAIGAIEAIRQRGLSVPDDVAVVGFDDIPAASWISPTLSTIAVFPYALGARIAKALFERLLDQYDGPARVFKIPCQLIERDST